MVEQPQSLGLQGRRVLLVEDAFLIADALAKLLTAQGVEVVGPVGQLDDALALATSERLDAAILDINLHGELSYPVVDALQERGVPVVFATGYASTVIPAAYAEVQRWEKPFDYTTLARALPSLIRAV